MVWISLFDRLSNNNDIGSKRVLNDLLRTSGHSRRPMIWLLSLLPPPVSKLDSKLDQRYTGRLKKRQLATWKRGGEGTGGVKDKSHDGEKG